MFALVILTTISFERICMESRYRYLDHLGIQQEVEKAVIVNQYYELESDYNKLVKQLEKRK